MFCRYFDNNRHPKFVIGPVKEEDEWDRPHILRYHDIVSDTEIELVKQLAKPRVSVLPRIYILYIFIYIFPSYQTICLHQQSPFFQVGDGSNYTKCTKIDFKIREITTEESLKLCNIKTAFVHRYDPHKNEYRLLRGICIPSEAESIHLLFNLND